MSGRLPLVWVILAGCGEWSLFGRGRDDCRVPGSCETDPSEELPCEPVTVPESALASADCLGEPDRFAVRRELELAGNRSGAFVVVVPGSRDSSSGPSLAVMKGTHSGWAWYDGRHGNEVAAWPQGPDSPLVLVDVEGNGTTEVLGTRVDLAGYPYCHWSQDAGHECPWPSLRSDAQSHSYAADADQDGTPEIVAGDVVTLRGSVLVENAVVRYAVGAVTAVADLDLNGTREVVTSKDVFRYDGTPMCSVTGGLPGHAYVTDLDGDGKPEVLALQHHVNKPPAMLRVFGPDCTVRQDVANPLEGTGLSYGSAVPTASVLTVAPLLEPGRQAVVLSSFFLNDAGEWRRATLILDHNLRTVRVLPAVQGTENHYATAADLDGDGVFELIMTGWGENRGGRIVDARTGEYHEFETDTLSRTLVADVDADRSAEIVSIGQSRADGTSFIRVYGSVGTPWRPATTASDVLAIPAHLNPDGSMSQEPTDWSRVGMIHATPTWSWWWGVGSDLVVRFADVCEDRCAEGRLTVWAQVGNQGTEEVGRPVRVRVYGTRRGAEELLGEQVYPKVPPGQWMAAEPMEIRYEGAQYERLRAVVEGADWTVDECDPANNEAEHVLGCDGG